MRPKSLHQEISPIISPAIPPVLVVGPAEIQPEPGTTQELPPSSTRHVSSGPLVECNRRGRPVAPTLARGRKAGLGGGGGKLTVDSLRSLVVPAIGVTIARLRLANLLYRVDFPTLGRPTMTTRKAPRPGGGALTGAPLGPPKTCPRRAAASSDESAGGGGGGAEVSRP